ncbi:MAG TPA: hypothetical protein VHE13_05370 [Opitutus sp.]|nr:hypothetical protein [Opitutus sp.]
MTDASRRFLVPALVLGLAFLAATGRWLDRPATIPLAWIHPEAPVAMTAVNATLPILSVRTNIWSAKFSRPAAGRVTFGPLPRGSRLALPVAASLSTPLRITWTSGTERGETVVPIPSEDWQSLPLPSSPHSPTTVQIEAELRQPGEHFDVAQPVFTDALHGPSARAVGRLSLWLFVLGYIAVLATFVDAVLQHFGPAADHGERLLCSLFALAVLGYIAFWTYFLHARAGDLAVTALALAAVAWWWRRTDRALAAWRNPDWSRGWLMFFGLGLLYFGFANTWTWDAPWSWAVARRYNPGLPMDNCLPQMFAQRLLDGVSPRHLSGDWLSSDRPPLQTGWILLLGPILRGSDYGFDSLSQAMGIVLQLLWLPALARFFQLLGLGLRRALLLCGLVALNGFTLLHSVYVWPKMCAGAFVLGAWAFLGARPRIAVPRRAVVYAGLGLALGFLSHGGVAFSILALGPLWLCSRQPAHWKSLALLGLIGALLCGPWSAYQRFYEPPGNRLLKWQLAGVVPPDPRGLGQTLRESYHAASWADIWHARRANFLFALRNGRWRDLADWSQAGLSTRRNDDFFFLLRSIGWWNFGLVALPFAWWRATRRDGRPAGPAAETATRVATAAFWIVGSLAIWIVVKFQPSSTSIHQGSYVVPLLLLGLAVWSLHRLHPLALAAVAVPAAGYFAATHGFAPPVLPDSRFGWVALVVGACGAATFAFAIRSRTILAEASPPSG